MLVEMIDFMKQEEGSPPNPQKALARRLIQETMLISSSGYMKGLAVQFYLKWQSYEKAKESTKKLQVLNVIDCVLFVEDRVFADFWCKLAELPPSTVRNVIHKTAAETIKRIISGHNNVPFPDLVYKDIAEPNMPGDIYSRAKRFFRHNEHAMQNLLLVLSWLKANLTHSEFHLGMAWEIMRYDMIAHGCKVCYFRKPYRQWAVQYIKQTYPELSPAIAVRPFQDNMLRAAEKEAANGKNKDH